MSSQITQQRRTENLTRRYEEKPEYSTQQGAQVDIACDFPILIMKIRTMSENFWKKKTPVILKFYILFFREKFNNFRREVGE